MRRFPPLLMLTLTAACSDLSEVGRAPAFTPATGGVEHRAMLYPTADPDHDGSGVDEASLWNAGRQSLLGDRRAIQRGDILTVVIEIDDSAEFSNTTSQSRSGSITSGIASLVGIPQRIDEILPEGATMADAVDASGGSSATGDGSVRRKEKLLLRVAATVIEVLPNGVLSIQGTQEVRVNNEIRELLVTGYIRPADISRQNEIEYDKIASARISYGGRGQLSRVQQPRYGQQVADIILPF